MKELFFVLKVFGFTFLIVLFMQIKVDELTLEKRTSIFIQDSWVTGQVQGVGDGVQKVLRQVTGSVGRKIAGIFHKESAQGFERGNFKLERSSTYKKEQEAKSADSERA
jgi:hypothetical protein